jgi:hypothetical protein
MKMPKPARKRIKSYNIKNKSKRLKGEEKRKANVSLKKALRHPFIKL